MKRLCDFYIRHAGVIERIAVEAPDTARGPQALVDDFQLGRIRELLREKT